MSRPKDVRAKFDSKAETGADEKKEPLVHVEKVSVAPGAEGDRKEEREVHLLVARLGDHSLRFNSGWSDQEKADASVSLETKAMNLAVAMEVWSFVQKVAESHAK
mmetsp:Transcript_9061/g.17755  ORF Transcript_9061/g.17755 Transcript_9061/m.17755 type:complete len:105 (-) Transcript_9061:351-665(-)